MMEEWKDINGFEGCYMVSNYGRIKTLRSTQKCIEGVLKPGITDIGYCIVVLTKDKIRKTRLVHRLVAKAFIPNPENKKEVNHIDFNKTNNHIANLEWSSHTENAYHYMGNSTRYKMLYGKNKTSEVIQTVS